MPLPMGAVVELRLYWGVTPQNDDKPHIVMRFEREDSAVLKYLIHFVSENMDYVFGNLDRVATESYRYKPRGKTEIEDIAHMLKAVTSGIYQGMFRENVANIGSIAVPLHVQMRVFRGKASDEVIGRGNWRHRRRIELETEMKVEGSVIPSSL